MSYCAAVITVSDRAFAGVYEDKSGPAVAEMLKEAGYEVVYTAIVPDEKEKIGEELISCADERHCDLIITNRNSPDLADVKDKVFTRDLFGNN